MNRFLFDLAKAHQMHEGWYPGSKSYRNNNPGNLRHPLFGYFLSFATYDGGFAALEMDLKAKIFGTAGTVQRLLAGTKKTYAQLVMQDYVAIYAPFSDGNNPLAYADALCARLSSYRIHPGTPLSVLAQLIRQEIDAVPEPAAPTMSMQQRLAAAENALRFASPERASMIRRLIARLQRALHIGVYS